MRRGGNTTLLQMIYDKISSNNKVFLDIENILEQKVFEETDFNNIWANLRAYDVSNREKSLYFFGLNSGVNTRSGFVTKD